MKTEFSKSYVLANKGCYEIEDVNVLPFDKEGNITAKTLFEVLPIKDFAWFLVNGCELTTKQKQLFALECAKWVLPIYQKRYPNDTRVSDCINAIHLYLDGKMSSEELEVKIDAAYATYATYDAATYATYATTYAAYDAATYATYAAANAAYAAANAANAAANDANAFREFISNYVFVTLVKSK